MQPGADGRIAAFFDSPQFGYVVGDASDPEVYQGKLKRFDRTVVFVKPGLFVIHDSLESAIAPARYDWLLHTVAPIEPGPAPQSFRLTSGAASLHGWFLLPADVETQVTKGFPVEPVDGYSTRPVPPEKYVDEWTLTATPQTPRESESFLTVLVVRREGDQHAGAQPVPWVIVETGTASVATDGVPEIPSLVAFRKVGATRMAYSVGGVDVDTDASVFANGLGLFVVGATDLTVGGVVWLRSTAPVTASLAETPGSWSAHLQTAEPARVSLRVKEVPKSVTVDGQPAALDFDANTSLATVRLEAGDHVIGAVRD